MSEYRRARSAASGVGCGARQASAKSLTLGTFTASKRGVFAFGRIGAGVAGVRVRFDGEDWRDAETLPTPIPPGGRDGLWVAPAEGDCPALTAQALDRDGGVLDEQRIDATPSPPAGAPDPQAACGNG